METKPSFGAITAIHMGLFYQLTEEELFMMLLCPSRPKLQKVFKAMTGIGLMQNLKILFTFIQLYVEFYFHIPVSLILSKVVRIAVVSLT